MQYFHFTDLNKWKSINERHYASLKAQDPDMVTQQHIQIRRNASTDPVSYAAAITETALLKVASYLSTEEQAEFTSGLSPSINPEWRDWEVVE